jgi:hypothetical protein
MYLFRQKLNLVDLAGLAVRPKRILIYEPEDYLAALYAHYLRAHNFDIKHCPNLNEIAGEITSFQPHLVIFSTDRVGQRAKFPGLILSLSRKFPDLHFLTTGYNLSHEGIKELMSAGVESHLNRRLSRPQDIPVLVETILQ